MKGFSSWLQTELANRQWSQSEFARRSQLSTGTISSLLSESRDAGPEIARKIAHALRVPERVVFFEAGLLTEDPGGTIDPITLDLVSMLENRSETEKRIALETVKAVLESFDGGKRGRSGR